MASGSLAYIGRRVLRMATYDARWTGTSDDFSDGEWRLTRDGIVSYLIPPDLRYLPMSTAGVYAGMGVDDWCRHNAAWLADIAPRAEWASIFDAFQRHDFRVERNVVFGF